MPKKTRPPKEGWWHEARNNLMTQALALLLLPVSVALTYYLTRYYTAPKPLIQFVSVIPVTLDGPPDSIRMEILHDPYLGEFIWKEPILLNSQESKDWLNGSGKWTDDCQHTFASLVQKMTASIGTAELQWDPRIVSQSYTVWVPQKTNDPEVEVPDEAETHYHDVTVYDSYEEAPKVVAILDDLSKELAQKGTDSIRTGEIDVKVGLLNPGDSDGVIYSDATLTCGADAVIVKAASNVDVKARSFSEITFSTRAELQGGQE